MRRKVHTLALANTHNVWTDVQICTGCFGSVACGQHCDILILAATRRHETRSPVHMKHTRLHVGSNLQVHTCTICTQVEGSSWDGATKLTR